MSENIEKLEAIEQKLASTPEALLENPEFVIQLFELSPDAIVVIDESGELRLMNAQAELLFGYSRKEVIGKPIEVLMPEEYREAHRKHTADFFRNPHVRPMGLLDPHFKPINELEGQKKDGARFGVDINLAPLVSLQGTFVIATVRPL